MFVSLGVRDTLQSADSVEFCPWEPVFVVGTYALVQGSDRIGRIDLMDDQLNVLQSIDTHGILDMKWCHHSHLLGVVTSTGQIQLYSMEEKQLSKVHTFQEKEQGILNLSMDWSNRVLSSLTPHLVISQSNGHFQHFELQKDNTLVPLRDYKAHDFEAWIAAFDYWDPQRIFTGGDDCLFKGWDMRSGSCTFTSKRHEAGVCSIASHPLREHVLVTGSYDEQVRLWDTRNMSKEISRVNLGGGVWRLKWHPTRPELLLTACMYNGFHIVSVDQQDTLMKVDSYMKHDSIAYGADWSFGLDRDLIGTCSFYDHVFHLNEWTL